MDNIFIAPAPAKKIRKKREFTPEQKRAFIERMKVSRLKKKEEKLKLSNTTPTSSIKNTNSVVNSINTTPDQPLNNVPNNTPTQQKEFDYSHFSNLSNNLNMLNATLNNLSKQRQHNEPKPQPIVVEKPQPIVEEIAPPLPKKVWHCGKRCFIYK